MTSSSDCPLISILVPIYNVERYLRQCLDSICRQTLQDIEIICINDGSTDSSLDIIKEFADQDARIIIIDKPNSGYGDSMNQGLKTARGKYIGIVESDDWVDQEAFKSLYLLAEAYDVEVVRANYYRNKGGKDEKLFSIDPHDASHLFAPRHRTKIFYQAPSIWASIYRRDFLTKNSIDFLPTPGASYQDTSFSFKVWTLAERAYFTPEAYLHYRIDNENSSVNNPGKVFCVCEEYAEIERFLKDRGLYDQMVYLMQATKATGCYWNMMRLTRKYLPEFIERAKAEYLDAEAAGQIIHEYYLAPKFWQTAQNLIHKSVAGNIRFVRWQKFKTKTREVAKKFYCRLRPSYVKQLEISHALDELYAQSDLCQQRLKMLTTNSEEKHV